MVYAVEAYLPTSRTADLCVRRRVGTASGTRFPHCARGHRPRALRVRRAVSHAVLSSAGRVKGARGEHAQHAEIGPRGLNKSNKIVIKFVTVFKCVIKPFHTLHDEILAKYSLWNFCFLEM